jgi:hypothetical protein
LERWQQYFKELLNSETERINRTTIHEGPINSTITHGGPINSTTIHGGPINNLELEKTTYEEINEIIKNTKSNKAAGSDEIIPEFIKNGSLL